LLERLYDPQSPDYHHFLSVQEFTEEFGPTQQDYDAVVHFAQANGLTVTATVPNRRLVDVEGSVTSIGKALHVAMGVYQHPSENRTFFAPDREPTTGLPFPDNKIPVGRIDTAVSGLMNLFPLPNATGDLNNYVRNALAQDNDDSYDGRIDFTLNSKNNFFGRYSYSNRFRFIPGYLGGIADGTSTSAWGRQFLKSYSFVLGYTHTFTPTLVNDFHFGWIRNYSYAEQDPFGKNAADEFVPGIPNNPAIAGGVPLTTFSNFGFIGSPDFLPKRQIPMQYQYSDTISWTHGAHSFKFGGTLWAPMRNIFQDEPGTRGDLGFTGVFTSCAGAGGAACPKGSGLSYADGLLGLTQSTQLTNVFFVDQRLWMLAGFAEDDWFCGDNALPFLHCEGLVGFYVRDCCFLAAGPGHH